MANIFDQFDSPSNVFDQFDGGAGYGIEFDQPVEAVRAAIAKLPKQHREGAMRAWADAYVAREAQEGGAGLAVDNVLRTAARGTFVGPFLDEATAAAQGGLHTISGGYLGSPYDEALAYQRARDRRVDKEYPVGSTVGQLASGLVSGGAALKAAQRGPGAISAAVGGPLAYYNPAATGTRRVGQAVGVGGLYGASAGFGHSEGGEGDTLTQLARRGEGALKGGALGAGLGVVLGGAGEGARRVAQARSNYRTRGYGDVAEALPGSVDDLADEIAVGFSGRELERARRDLRILGEEMARMGGDRQRAVESAIARISQEGGVTPATARQRLADLRDLHQESPLLFGEHPAVSRADMAQRPSGRRTIQHVDPDSVGEPRSAGSQDLMEYLAHSGTGRSVQDVRNAVAGRQRGLADEFAQVIQRWAPDGRTLADADDLIAQASARSSAAYRAALDNETPFDLQRILDIWTRRVAGRQSEHGRTMQDAIDIFTNRIRQVGDDGRPLPVELSEVRPITRLRDFIERRKELATLIDRSLGPNGRPTALTRELTRFKRTVDAAVGRVNPLWRRANDMWSDMRLDERALEFGQRMTERASWQQRQALREFDRMAPEAQDMMRLGFIQKLFDKLDGLGETHDVAKLFDKGQMRNVIRHLFGNEAAVALARAVRDQKVATRSMRALGGSPTHRRGVMQDQIDAEINLLGSVDQMNVRSIRGWLLNLAQNWMRERRNRAMADILTTPMRDTAGVAEIMARLRAAQAERQRFTGPPTRQLPAAAAVGAQAGRLAAGTP